jgi:FkbM family methyltransferase
MGQLHRVLREVQSRFGFALESKAYLQRQVRRLARRPFEPEFCVTGHIDFTNRCAVDIGANRGQSIDAIRLFNPACPILAFEPNAMLAEKLTRQFRHDAAVKIHNLGLGNEKGQLALHVPFYRGFMYDGLASMKREEAAGWLNAETMWNFDPEKLRVEESRCDIARLDDLDLNPAFVKIDVQGFESNVLNGGRETLERHKPVVLIENNPDAEALLTSWGWTAFGFQGVSLKEGMRGLDNVVFLNRQSAEHNRLIESFSSST